MAGSGRWPRGIPGAVPAREPPDISPYAVRPRERLDGQDGGVETGEPEGVELGTGASTDASGPRVG
ncbi:MAG: hypothetical protein WBP39_09105, partial [Candidatus Phosphoribacter baldrii]